MTGAAMQETMNIYWCITAGFGLYVFVALWAKMRKGK